MRELTQTIIDDLTYQIIGAAIEVHQELGPGLLESVYETCMAYELETRGLKIVTQKTIPLVYKDIQLKTNLRFDILVEDCIVVELKAVTHMHPVFEAQAMTYARLLKKPKAILINFASTNIFKYGQKTFVNEFFDALPK